MAPNYASGVKSLAHPLRSEVAGAAGRRPAPPSGNARRRADYSSPRSRSSSRGTATNGGSAASYSSVA